MDRGGLTEGKWFRHCLSTAVKSLSLDSSEDGVVGGFASIHVRAARPDRSISYIVLIIRHITPGYRHSIGRSLDILKLSGNIGRQWTRAVLRQWTTQCTYLVDNTVLSLDTLDTCQLLPALWHRSPHSLLPTSVFIDLLTVAHQICHTLQNWERGNQKGYHSLIWKFLCARKMK